MIFEKLVEIFGTVTPEIAPEEITRESSLEEDLGMNSLTSMLLAVSIEDEFDIKFEGAGSLETVQDVIDFICEKTGLED